MHTADGRIPPNAVYNANLPTGIPIPWNTSNIIILLPYVYILTYMTVLF